MVIPTQKNQNSLQTQNIESITDMIIDMCPQEEMDSIHFGNGFMAENKNKDGCHHTYRLVFPNGYAVQAAPKHRQNMFESILPKEMTLQFKLPGSEKFLFFEELSLVQFRTFEFLFIVMKGQVDTYFYDRRNTQKQIARSANVIAFEKR